MTAFIKQSLTMERPFVFSCILACCLHGGLFSIVLFFWSMEAPLAKIPRIDVIMVEREFVKNIHPTTTEKPSMRSIPRHVEPAIAQSHIKQLVKFSPQLAQPQPGVQFSPSSSLPPLTTKRTFQDSAATRTLAMQDLLKMAKPLLDTKPPRSLMPSQASGKNTNGLASLPTVNANIDRAKMTPTHVDHSALSSINRLPLTLQPQSGEEQALTGSKVQVDHSTLPVYPRIAREQKWEGTVFLRVVIQPDGSQENLTVRKSSGYDILDKAAIEAVSAWRFIAARDGNIPIKSMVEIPVRFRLQQPKG